MRQWGNKYNTPTVLQKPPAEIKEELKIKTIPKIAFMCELCGNTFKKETTLIKHVKTKHQEQKCKVCNVNFKIAMEVLEHVSKEHRNNIKEDNSVRSCEHSDQIETAITKEKQDNFDPSRIFQMLRNSCT